MATTASVIGQNIREARRARMWTQKELGARVGVEAQSISNLERGVYMPSWPTLRALAEVFGTSTEELISDNGTVAA